MIFTTKSDKVTSDGKNNESFYQSQLADLHTKQLVVLEGHHYLHWTQSKEISKYTQEFVRSFEQDRISTQRTSIEKIRGGSLANLNSPHWSPFVSGKISSKRKLQIQRLR